MFTVVDAENHDTNENGAEDDMDKKVSGFNDGSLAGNSVDKVADSEASANEARVGVRRWLHFLD